VHIIVSVSVVASDIINVDSVVFVYIMKLDIEPSMIPVYTLYQ